MRQLFHTPPWLQEEMLEKCMLITGMKLTAEGREEVLNRFDGFCTDQLLRVTDSLQQMHRRIRLGPEFRRDDVKMGRPMLVTKR